MSEPLAGFDWDAGNLAKCQKHGVPVAEIEALFDSPLLIVPDAAHSKTEARSWAIGKSGAERMIFIVFTVRVKKGRRLIRPISARYMHAKEIASYEKENPQL
ncbi:MAG: BrnT family toxin [Steroidobacteraceae bacterium]